MRTLLAVDRVVIDSTQSVDRHTGDRNVRISYIDDVGSVARRSDELNTTCPVKFGRMFPKRSVMVTVNVTGTPAVTVAGRPTTFRLVVIPLRKTVVVNESTIGSPLMSLSFWYIRLPARSEIVGPFSGLSVAPIVIV